MITEDLSTFQLEKLRELRQRLGDQLLADTPLFNDDISLFRWLVGWDYNIDEIVPRLSKASKALQCMSLTDVCIEDIDELNIYLNKLTNVSQYYSSSVLGLDDNGNIIVINCVGSTHPKSLSKSAKVSDLYIFSITEAVLVYQLVKSQERKLGRKCGLRALVDLDGFNTDHLNNAALKIFMNLLKQLQSMFVDTTLQIYVINAHPIATAAFKLVFTVLPKQTRSKLMMLGSDYRTFLINELGAHNLYEKWGGTKKPEKGHPETGYLRVGGVVPETKRYAIEMKIKEFENVEVVKFNVAPRRCKEIDIPAVEKGKFIHWFFITSSDVEFSITTKDDEQAWPQFRLSTNHVPEYGSILCRTAGDYKAKFDNTFSTFFSKDIHFKFVVKDN